MFTQFFGSYLISQKFISLEALSNALKVYKKGSVKLGILAMHKGYLTSKQVDELHSVQQHLDKRIGDIAIEKGYLVPEQLEELLSLQKIDYLSLGQALIDQGSLTNEAFEKALAAYKRVAQVEEEKNTFFIFDTREEQLRYNDYIRLLTRNFVRFVGDDFVLGELTKQVPIIQTRIVSQCLKGEKAFHTGIVMEDDVMRSLAKRFCEDDYIDERVYIESAVGEFINLQNGLFSVNLSNNEGVELDLEPQAYGAMDAFELCYSIPFHFSFGTVRLLLTDIA